jgi:LDH2 family malate/lactate/ureidoglycolate dehydrogenase
MAEDVLVKVKALTDFVMRVFERLGVPADDARTAALVLLSSDLRGIPSHGLARLRRYVKDLQSKVTQPKPKIRILKETSSTLLIDGNDGLGMVVGTWSMNKVIEKAKQSGVCFASIRNSNHYGIAGYYSMMALEHDLIGISMTNSAPLVVPTFGKDAIIGTNPISFAFPAGNERPFVLDMAAATAPRGKLEDYVRKDKVLPITWATDENGSPTTDGKRVLDNLINRKGGGLLPLGGGDEETGGHKGYGLSVVIDILSGILSGGAYGPLVYGKKNGPANVCHFLGAMKIDAFIPKDEFKKGLDGYIQLLKSSAKAAGKDRIYVAGEKEYEKQEAHTEQVAVYSKVLDDLRAIGQEVGAVPDF